MSDTMLDFEVETEPLIFPRGVWPTHCRDCRHPLKHNGVQGSYSRDGYWELCASCSQASMDRATECRRAAGDEHQAAVDRAAQANA